MKPIRLSPTSLSQYIRMENCERYLRFRLVPGDAERLEKKWGLTIQPLTPLLQESGQNFEQGVFERVLLPGDKPVDLDKKDVGATLHLLREVRSPIVLIQPTLEAQIDHYQLGGRADVIRLTRDRQRRLNVLIAAISRPRKKLIVLTSRSVIGLLTSDLEIFNQSVIWKRLYHHYTPDVLLKEARNGYQVIVRGRRAG